MKQKYFPKKFLCFQVIVTYRNLDWLNTSRFELSYMT